MIFKFIDRIYMFCLRVYCSIRTITGNVLDVDGDAAVTSPRPTQVL